MYRTAHTQKKRKKKNADKQSKQMPARININSHYNQRMSQNS